MSDPLAHQDRRAAIESENYRLIIEIEERSKEAATKPFGFLRLIQHEITRLIIDFSGACHGPDVPPDV